jgi:hypothetical protein
LDQSLFFFVIFSFGWHDILNFTLAIFSCLL